MIFEGIILAVLVAYMRKGRLRYIEDLEIKGWYFFVVSQIIQFVAIRLNGRYFELDNQVFYLLHLLSYGMLFVPMVMNHRLLSMKIIALGTFLNAIPIALNNGQMPVALPEGFHASFDLGHVIADGNTIAYYLGDIIPLIHPYPIQKIISIGDVFLVVGVFMLIQVGMKPKGKVQQA